MAQTAAAAPAKKKFCYMLHDPATMAFAGKYNSASHRYAALKAATKGVENILLRQTNTKVVHKYQGSTEPLDKPRIVKRKDREIGYSKKPKAVYLGHFDYDGKLPDEDNKENVKPEEAVPSDAALESKQEPAAERKRPVRRKAAATPRA